MKVAIVFRGHGLDARRTIDVCDSRQCRPMVFTDIYDHDHVRQFGTWFDVEPGVRLFCRYGRGKGTKGLALFDHGVDSISHFRMTWIGEDTAVSERARAELHSATMPCNDLSPCNPICSFGTCALRIGKTFHLDQMRMLSERFIHFTLPGSRSEERYRHAPIANAIVNRRPLQCSPERRAIIAGSRLDIDLIEET